MFKMSKMTDYAVLILRVMDSQKENLLSAHDIANQSLLPEPTVAKLLKYLVRTDIVRSIRGANGGYILTKSIEEISVADLIEAIDGPVSLVACVEGHGGMACGIENDCPVRGGWDELNHEIVEVLNSFTLDRLIKQNHRKTA